jgi:hypothetical protein
MEVGVNGITLWIMNGNGNNWNTDGSGNGNERTEMGGNGNEKLIPAHLYGAFAMQNINAVLNDDF